MADKLSARTRYLAALATFPTKLRRLELTAGHAPARGQRGSAYDYNIKATRDQERRRVQQAEKIYMSGLSPAGTEVAQGCARALQKRSDNNGCAARLSPQTLLFATQSLARLYSIAEDSQENACRLHPSSKDDLALSVDAQSRALGTYEFATLQSDLNGYLADHRTGCRCR